MVSVYCAVTWNHVAVGSGSEHFAVCAMFWVLMGFAFSVGSSTKSSTSLGKTKAITLTFQHCRKTDSIAGQFDTCSGIDNESMEII